MWRRVWKEKEPAWTHGHVLLGRCLQASIQADKETLLSFFEHANAWKWEIRSAVVLERFNSPPAESLFLWFSVAKGLWGTRGRARAEGWLSGGCSCNRQ